MNIVFHISFIPATRSPLHFVYRSSRPFCKHHYRTSVDRLLDVVRDGIRAELGYFSLKNVINAINNKTHLVVLFNGFSTKYCKGWCILCWTNYGCETKIKEHLNILGFRIHHSTIYQVYKITGLIKKIHEEKKICSALFLALRLIKKTKEFYKLKQKRTVNSDSECKTPTILHKKDFTK